MPVFARSPTATAFATAWVDTVLKPALGEATGADKKLSAKEAAAAKTATSGPLALAGGALEEIRKEYKDKLQRRLETAGFPSLAQK